jgi:hypothetical protein
MRREATAGEFQTLKAPPLSSSYRTAIHPESPFQFGGPPRK